MADDEPPETSDEQHPTDDHGGTKDQAGTEDPDRPITRDEDGKTPSAGFFRRFRQLVQGSGSAGTSFSVFEEIFAPTRHQARVEIQAQQRAVKPAPAPTDPPDLEPPGPGGKAADRYQGRVVIRRPPRSNPDRGREERR